MKKLSDIQIDHLYEFTKNHYVEWYDVQTELVDHLANGIENQWKIEPDFSFENALIKEFKKFGVFGFSDLIKEKTKALNKCYRKHVWIYFKEFFRLPKIIITLFSVWMLSLILGMLQNKLYVTVPFVFIIFVMHVTYVYTQKKQIKYRISKNGKNGLWIMS